MAIHSKNQLLPLLTIHLTVIIIFVSFISSISSAAAVNKVRGSQNPFASVEEEEPETTEFNCSGRDCGRYADPDVCSGYFVCGNDATGAEHRFCENGLVFNEISSACDLPTNVTCGERFNCDGKGCGRYPDTKNCDGYFVCGGGVGLRQMEAKSCPAGLLFNPQSQDCDFPERVNCAGSTTTTTTEPTTTPACEQIQISVSTGGPCGGVTDCAGDCTKAGFKQFECLPHGCRCFCK